MHNILIDLIKLLKTDFFIIKKYMISLIYFVDIE